MNVIEQAALANVLRRALRDAGIGAGVVMGNVRGWAEVPAEGIIDRWLQNGWRVTLT